MAKEEQDKAAEDEGKKEGASMLKVIIISVVLSVVLGGGLVGGTIFLLGDSDDSKTGASTEAGDETEEAAEDEESDKVPDGPVTYTEIDPKFVVSFDDQRKARFMQFGLQIMTRDSEVTKDIEIHKPAIRSNLLMLIGSQPYEIVSTREGKEQLLIDITNNINTTLDSLGANSGVEAAYFDSFIIQ